jgi:hypothetical protein
MLSYPTTVMLYWRQWHHLDKSWINILSLTCFAQNGLHRISYSMRYFPQKSILTKQINDSIYIYIYLQTTLIKFPWSYMNVHLFLWIINFLTNPVVFCSLRNKYSIIASRILCDISLRNPFSQNKLMIVYIYIYLLPNYFLYYKYIGHHCCWIWEHTGIKDTFFLNFFYFCLIISFVPLDN